MLATTDLSQFLQSEKWVKFQELGGQQVIKINDSFFVEKYLGGGWKYLYGAKINGQDLINWPPKLATKKIVFVRFEPLLENNPASLFNQAAFKEISKTTSKATFEVAANIIKTIDIQPSQTLILDLSLTAAELLQNMHAKTRYNLRLAQKKGVKIFADNSRIDDFLNLLKTTTERDKFLGHADAYYRRLAALDSNFIKLFLAEYDGRIIAAGLFSFYGNCVTYLHGASSNQDRQVMAPYLLQWHLISLAQEQGYKYYDFFGIDEKKWPGVTRFKLGWGGEVLKYPGTFDYVLNPKIYKFYKFFRHLRRFIRRGLEI